MRAHARLPELENSGQHPDSVATYEKAYSMAKQRLTEGFNQDGLR
jgi:hypothetical protein